MRKVLASIAIAAGLLASGCATEEGARLARQPPLPPAFVLKANPLRSLYHNVTIEEVAGAPEFDFFTGGSLISTRPTRAQILSVLQDDLYKTDLLAPSKIAGEYMLYVKFEDLHGPDVWTFSDKKASASIYFRLVRWRTGQVIKQARVAVAYQANFNGLVINGVSPEITRDIIAGPQAPTDIPMTLYTYSDGNTGGLLAEATPGVDPITGSASSALVSSSAELGPFDGASRRSAATRGMLSLAFDEFTDEVSKDGSLVYKQAVSCAELNPSYSSHTFAFQMETDSSYAVDCPGAEYKFNRLRALYPSRF